MTNLVTSKKILVMRDIVIDHYIYGHSERISPETPVRVIEITSDIHNLGASGNIVKNLVLFDFQPDTLTLSGNDTFAQIIIQQLSSLGIATDGFFSDELGSTTLETRIIVLEQQLLRIDKVDRQFIDHALKKKITQCDKIVIAMSEQGIAYFSNEQLFGANTDVTDITDIFDSGDTVPAALTSGIVSGWSLTDTSKYANQAASTIVRKAGSMVPIGGHYLQLFK